MTNLTVGQIAELIAEPGEDLKAVVDRLRSWTKEGVLKPVGDKKPGTGRKIVYSGKALVDAAVLSMFARWGFWAPRVHHLGGALDLAYRQVPKAKLKSKDGQDIYLLIGEEEGSRQIIARPIFVDSATRSRPTKAGPSNRQLAVPTLVENGYFINLTRLFERIGVPLAGAEAEERFFKKFLDARRIRRA